MPLHINSLCLRSVLLAASAALILNGCDSPPGNVIEATPVQYDLKRTPEGVTISLAFKGEVDGTTDVLLGGEWADEENPHTRFRNVRVNQGEIEDKGERITLAHAPGANLILSYDLNAGDQRDRASDPIYFFAPVLTDKYIHLIGYTSLAVPDLDSEIELSYTGDWADNAEGTLLRSRVFKSGAAINGTQAQSGFIMSGTFELAESADGRVQVAASPGVSVSAQDILDEAAPLLDALANLWDGTPIDYSVTLLPFETEQGTVLSGTAFPGGFVAALTPDLKTEDIQRFLAHEIAHEIIPIKLGVPEHEGTGREGEGYWISEGFAEFLSRQAQLAAGTLDRDGLARRINEDILRLYQSEVRNAPNGQIGTDFWTNPDIERLPYLRGALLAHKWDASILEKSSGTSGMMDVLRDLGDRAKAPDVTLTVEAILGALETRGATNARADFERVILLGEDFSPPSEMLGECYVTQTINQGTYTVGFDASATLAAGVVSGVSDSSAAYDAGLRNGMGFLEKVSGGGGNMSAPLIIRVDDGDQPIQLSYVPVGEPFEDVPQFIRKPDCKL